MSFSRHWIRSRFLSRPRPNTFSQWGAGGLAGELLNAAEAGGAPLNKLHMCENAAHRPMVSRAYFRCAFILAFMVASLGARADEAQDRRAQTGARLFRSLLAADLDLARKTIDKNQLLIVFYYVDDKRRASDLAARFLGDAKEIKELPVTVEITNDPTLAQYSTRVPGGIFLADAPPNKALQSIIQYGIQHHTIVYSPFEGHVEKGVLGGLAVEAQVRPYVNVTTLSASNISLKPFFLHVMKAYQ